MGVFISISRDIFKNTLLEVVSSLNLLSVNKVAKLFQIQGVRGRGAPKCKQRKVKCFGKISSQEMVQKMEKN